MLVHEKERQEQVLNKADMRMLHWIQRKDHTRSDIFGESRRIICKSRDFRWHHAVTWLHSPSCVVASCDVSSPRAGSRATSRCTPSPSARRARSCTIDTTRCPATPASAASACSPCHVTRVKVRSDTMVKVISDTTVTQSICNFCFTIRNSTPGL